MPITLSKFSQEVIIKGRPTWIGFEFAMNDGDTPQSALDAMQKEVDAYVDKYKPSKNAPVAPPPYSDRQIDSKEAEMQKFKDEIAACTQLEGPDGLKSLWTRAKSNLTLLEAYKEKEKQLINQ